jgi:chitinase
MWNRKSDIGKLIFSASLVFLVCAISSTVAQSKKKVVCYYGTWATYRDQPGKFDVSNVNPFICTHIIYTFFGINTNDIISLDPYLDYAENWGRNNIKKFISLKTQNPDVKLLAAIGGWNFGSTQFSLLAADATLRNQFANNALKFLRTYGFDGLDIDWEYPNQRGGRSIDLVNFPLFLRDLYNVLKPNGLLLTVAVTVTPSNAKLSYNIPEVNKYVDFINLMTYDLNGSWNPYTGLHSALYSGTGDKSYELNVDACVKYWISAGAPREKLILGLATYGRSFKLKDERSNGLYAAANGPGTAGPWTKEAGFMGYNEICYYNWNSTYDSVRKAVYASKGSDWVGYDDVISISDKAYYILQNQLGGAMFWSLETDDFGNICRQGNYPLITKVVSILNSGTVPSTTNPPITTLPTTIPQTTTPPTTTRPPTLPTTISTKTSTSPTTTTSSSGCNFRGFQRDPIECDVFYQCSNGRLYKFRCITGLYFDTNFNVCNWKFLVKC